MVKYFNFLIVRGFTMIDYKDKYNKLYDVTKTDYAASVLLNLNGDIESNKYLLLMKFYESHKDSFESSVEVGASVGHLNKFIKNWRGVEYSDIAVMLGKKLYGESLELSQGDSRNL